MIIGIDETGTFDLNSKGWSWFVGVHVHDQTELEELSKKFQGWKDAHRHLKKGSKNEIKGSDLDQETMFDFVSTVIQPLSFLYITCVCTDPSAHRKKDIQFHRDHHVTSINRGIERCREVGNERLAKQYEELRNWYKKINYQLLLKTWILGQMIGLSYREHIIQTILDKTDLTLGTIQLLIDRDFIKSGQPTIYWKDLLRSWFYSYTYRHPIPIIREWNDDHPFFMARFEKEKPKEEQSLFLDENHTFKDNCNFVSSHEFDIVQVADIIASPIANYHRDRSFKDSYAILREKMIPVRQNPIPILQMVSPENAQPDTTPDPYKQLRKDS